MISYPRHQKEDFLDNNNNNNNNSEILYNTQADKDFSLDSTTEIKSFDTTDDNISSSAIDIEFQLHPRRWLVLASYCLLSLVCGSNWLCFPAVSNILRQYYSVGILSINMLTIVFGISIVIFSIPFAILLDKYGLSVVMKTSALFNLIGATVKYFGDNPEYGYWFLLIGNTFHALSVAGFLFLPGDIATTWFGDGEHGKATSLCVAFDALGTGLGFLVASSIITNDPDTVIVGKSIRSFLLVQMIPSIFVFAFVVMFVRRRPTQPPNLKELMVRHDQLLRHHNNLQCTLDHTSTTTVCKESSSIICHHRRHTGTQKIDHYRVLMRSLKSLLTNKDFQLIFHMQGIVASIEGLFEILLNEMLVDVYPGHEHSIGILGFVSVICGFLTNIIVGTLLDKTGRYRFLSFIIFISSTILASCWFITFEYFHNFVVISIIQSLLMSTITSYYTLAFAHSERVAGKVSPSAVGVLLVLTSQVYDTVSSFVGTEILACLGSQYVNGLVVVMCAIATVATIIVGNKKLDTVLSVSIVV